MQNVKSSRIDTLKATHELNELAEYGRQLHSEAVFMGVMNIFRFFRHGMPKTVQFTERRENLKYSH
jgi:hypothetical protein